MRLLIYASPLTNRQPEEIIATIRPGRLLYIICSRPRQSFWGKRTPHRRSFQFGDCFRHEHTSERCCSTRCAEREDCGRGWYLVRGRDSQDPRELTLLQRQAKGNGMPEGILLLLR